MAFRTNKTPVLQTKSASGSVATFNTALAMPLSSCNIALTATQSGSGTPSPDNVRNINGYSNIDISATGKNIGNKDLFVRGTIIGDGTDGASSWRLRSPFIPVKPDTSYSIMCNSEVNIYEIHKYGANGEYYGYNAINAPSNVYNFPSNVYYTKILIRYSNNKEIYVTDLTQFQIAESETALPYEPFGTYTTITIGSTVYGGEYDARTGVLTVTHKLRIFNGSEVWLKDGENTGRYLVPNWVAQISIPYNNDHYQNICPTATTWAELNNSNNACYFASSLIYKVDNSLYPTVEDFKNFISQNNLQVCYPLATPEVINLGGMEIDTLQGVNNIWADTGDIDLTYKDLDIAKRGNFREVFKLPS